MTTAMAPVVPVGFSWASLALRNDRSAWLLGLTYDEVSRAHTFNGAPILSVTQVLQEGGKTDFSMVKAPVLQRKMLIGTAAHIAAHYYDDGDLERATVDVAVQPYLAGWELFRRERHFVPLCLETVIFSRRYGYTGRLDRVGIVPGFDRLVLVDIKTGDPTAARADLQTYAYEQALDEEFGTGPLERWSVQVFPTGTYRLKRYPTESRSWRHDRAEFLEAISLVRERTGQLWSVPMPMPTATDDDPPPPDVEELPPPPPAEPPVEGTLVEMPPPPDDTPPSEQALIEAKRDTVITKAFELANGIVDTDTCQAAVNYATFIDDAIREAHAYFDPLVARARQPWDDRCAERKAVLDPLDAAKSLLVGRDGKVTAWLQEQQRKAAAAAAAEQRQRDAEAAEERRRLAAEAFAKELDAQAAKQAGDTERAAELARDAQAVQRQADATVAAIVQPTTTTVAGVGGVKAWTFHVDDLEQLVRAIARPGVIKEVIARIKGIHGWETATAPEIVAALDFFEGECVDIPFGAVEPHDAYLKARAKADRDTLKWPGVRFYDQGSSRLAPANRRKAS